MFRNLAFHPGAQNGSRRGAPGVLAQCALWLLTVMVIAAALYSERPPQALGADAPPTQFSAARALSQLQSFAQHPHPVGSEDHARVRGILVQALTALGAQVHVESGVGVFHPGQRYVGVGAVHNIVATFPGGDNQRAVMLTAHYDSVPYGPGAADDGAGVVSILEAMRAVRAGPPLRNDVRVVITDGEEGGLFGASAYVAAHPQLAQQVGVVLNFEARGSSGPVIMFETSDDNGWLIRQLAAAAPYPLASSLTYTAYQHMPNNTDLSVFKGAGLAGMNFALAGTYQNYHTPLDSVANLDPNTLQHMGSYALALTRHFGNATFPEARAPDLVYFNWLGNRLVHYPLWVMWVLLGLVGVLWIVVARMLKLRQHFKFSLFFIGFAEFFLVILVVLGSVSAVWWALHAFFGERLLYGDTPSNKWLVVGLILVGVVAALWLQSGLGGRRGGTQRSVGTLLGFGLLTVAVSIWLPGASFLFEWPLLFALAGVLLALVSRRPNAGVLWVWLGTVPVLLLFAPLLRDMLVMLGMTWMAVIVIALLLGLACAAAAPLLAKASRDMRVVTPLLLLGAAACLLVGVSLSRFSAQHPQRGSLYYSVDADHGKAAWVSWDARANPATASVLGSSAKRSKAPDFAFGSGEPVLMRPAPLLPLEAPQASVRSDVVDPGIRTLDVHFDSPRHAPVLRLRLGAQVRLLSLAWNGEAPVTVDADAAPDRPWRLTYIGVPATGVDLQLRVAGNAPLTCRMGDQSYGLPTLAEHNYQPTDDTMIVYGGYVLVSKRCAWPMPSAANAGTAGPQSHRNPNADP